MIFPSFLYFFSMVFLFAGIWVGENYVVRGPEYVQGKTFQVLASMWDAKRLTSIATDGYMWNGNAHQIQNIAYFPLYSLVEKIVGIFIPLSNPLALILPSRPSSFFPQITTEESG